MLEQNELNRSIYRGFGLAIGVAALSLMSAPTMAAIVCNTATVPLSIPNTFDGIYINFANGATGTTGASTPGWDWNPYNSGTALSFFWGTPSGGGVSTTTTTYDVLASGQTVGPASAFIALTATAATAPWKAGATGFLGVRFDNAGTTNYGWVNMTATATSGFPATINGFCFENTGASIVTGTTPVSLQGFSID